MGNVKFSTERKRKQIMLNEEITPLDQLIEWLQINHDITIPTDLFHELKRDEKIHAQWWYNRGFTKAKSIYLDAE
jgi:hypothetical protein